MRRGAGSTAAATARVGSVYLAVLMASLLVASLSMCAITTARYYARDLHEEADLRHAQLAADAALEWAVANINAASDWRTKHTHNVDSNPQTLGEATVRYRLIDDNGSLTADPYAPCDLLVTAQVRNAKFCWRATLAADGDPLSCLAHAASAKSGITPQLSAVWSTDGSLASGGNISVAMGASLVANTFSVGSTSGSVYGSTKSIAAKDLSIPSAAVIKPYLKMGTAIPAALLPTWLGTLLIDRQLLSAQANTISGQLNPAGVYVIDCQNQSIVISNSRLQCTLILTNVGNNSRVEQSVFWEAGRPDFPALLVDGRFEFSLTRNPLSESSVNFNPSGTPYRGVADANKTTIYPSHLRGLFYASDRVQLNTASSTNDIFGLIVSGESIQGSGNLFIHYRGTLAQNPPPGFRSFDKVRITAGTLRRVPAP